MRQTLKTHKRSGIALVAAMIFISVFMAATMGMLSMSSQNTIAASNLHKANMTRSTAESGLEIVRYWMQQADTSGAESEEDAFLLALDALETGLASAHVTFSNIYNPQNEWVGRRIENIVLQSDQSGNATNTVDVDVRYNVDKDAIVLDVSGYTRLNDNASELSRTLRVEYDFEGDIGLPELSPLFGHGIATKGTFEIDGGTVVGGYGSPSEGSIYIEAKKRQPVLSDWRQCQHLRQCQHRQP